MTRVSIRAKYSLKGFIGSKQKLDGHVNVGITEIEPVIQPLSISGNGTYTAPDDVDGYNPVTVDVLGAIEPPTLGFVPSAWDANGYITNGTLYGDKIPDCCFYSNSSKPYRFSDFVFPDRIKRIGHSAFYSCSTMRSKRLPNSLTEIGDYAFNSCAKITISSLPDGLVSIGTDAFWSCVNITVSRLPDSVETVGSGAFYNCNKISRFTINAGLKVIPSRIVVSSALTSITFLGTPDSINSKAFPNKKLTTINVPWSEGAVANAPWGATNATINYNYKGE